MRMTFRSAAAVLATVFVAVMAFTTASAGAQSDDAYVGAQVESSTQLNTEAPTAAPAAAVRGTSAANSTLAFTGGDVLAVALVGGVAVAAGASLLVVRRRTATAAV